MIPNSKSNNGIHIGNDGDAWIFADYQANFCEIGVEEGDLFVADRFYPLDDQAASDPSCEQLIKRTPGEGLDPLRYRVAAVSQHSLTLTPDLRTTYAPQLDLLGSNRLPKLAPPLPSPPAKCATQKIAYELRVGRDQWLVNTSALGFRHPWVVRDGACVQSAKRVASRRFGRARLGEKFSGEWFSFKLGYQQAEIGVSGLPEGSLPLMIGTRYDFFIERGALRNLVSNVGLAPQSMTWLPALERLFIVDVALKQVNEYTDLDPYNETIRLFQTFR